MPRTDVASVVPAGGEAVLVAPMAEPEPAAMVLPGARLNVRTVFDENYDFVWRALRRLGVDEADVDDAVQEVFLVVHRKLLSFEGRSRLSTWLFGICANVASERRRSSRRGREAVQTEAADDVADPSATPEERYAGREARAKLDEVLATLDDEKRAVFVLYEIDETPVERIAEMLSIPVGTVYSRLRAARIEFERALARLRRRWAHAKGGGP